MPKKEFDLLFKFLSYPGQVFTRSQLLDEIWGYDSFSSEDTIKTHVSRIRKKFDSFDEFKIVAVKGLGYKGEINKNKNSVKSRNPFRTWLIVQDIIIVIAAVMSAELIGALAQNYNNTFPQV